MMSLGYQYFEDGTIDINRLLIRTYKKLNISFPAFTLLLYLIEQQREAQFETNLDGVGRALGFHENEEYDYFSELLDAKLIGFEVVKDQNGKQHDVINFESLYDFILQSMEKPSNVALAPPQPNSLISIFEGEFGRSLTQMELMQVTKWKQEDQFSDELIVFALQEAVLNQAISLRYIDTILLNWKKKNVRTVEEAQRERDSFNQAKAKHEIENTTEFEPFKLPDINWNGTN